LSDESNIHHTETALSVPIKLTDDVFTEEPNSQRRKSVKSRNNSTTQTHEPPPAPEIQHQSSPNTPITNNKKRKTSIL
jgi:hypothetical protein